MERSTGKEPGLAGLVRHHCMPSIRSRCSNVAVINAMGIQSHPSIAPYGAFLTADGKKLLISIQNERE